MSGSSTIGQAQIIVSADASGVAEGLQRTLKQQVSKFGTDLSNQLKSAVTTGADKMVQPVVTATQRASAAIKKPIQDFSSGFKDAQAAASSFTGKMGEVGAKTRTALNPTIQAVQNLAAGFNDPKAAASSFTGKMGEMGGKIRAAITPAEDALRNLSAGFNNPQYAAAALSGKMGTLGGVLRSTFNGGAAVASKLGSFIQSAMSVGASAVTAFAKGAYKAFTEVGKVAADAMKRVGGLLVDGMKTAGNIGGTALAAAATMAIGSGFKRLVTIDVAETKMKAMGLDVKSVMDTVSASIDGTAFAMGEAADAAALFSTSGIQAGAGMENAMAGLVATAAATGTGMNDVANIMQKVAASPKQLTGAMTELSTRGVNANAALAKSLGKTSEEITKMASDGEISFEQFSAAMAEQLGPLGAAMGTTLPGMFSKIRAQISKLGAAASAPLFEGVKAALPGVYDLFKNASDAVKELTAGMENSLVPAGEKLRDALSGFNFDWLTKIKDSEFVKVLSDNLGSLAPVIGGIAGAFGPLLAALPVIGPLFAGISAPLGILIGLFVTMFKESTALQELFKGAGGAFAKFAESLMPVIDAVLQLVGTVGKELGDAFAEILLALLPVISDLLTQLVPVLLPLIQMIAELAVEIGKGLGLVLIDLMKAILPPLIDALETLAPVFKPLLKVVGEVVNVLAGSLGKVLGDLIVQVLPVLVSLLEVAAPIVQILGEAFKALLPLLVPLLKTALIPLMAILKPLIPVFELLGKALGWVAEQFGSFVDDSMGPITEFADGLSGMMDGVAKPIEDVINWIIENVPVAFEWIKDAVQNVGQFFTDVWTNVSNAVKAVWENFLKPVFDAIGATIKWVWETILQPIFNAFQVGFALLAGILQGIWDFILKPVFDAIGAVFKWLWDTIISVVVNNIKLAIQGWAAIFNWLWTVILKPIFDALGAAFKWIYETIILPIVNNIKAAIQMWADIFNWLWLNVIQPVFAAIGAAFDWLYQNVIVPNVEFIKAAIKVAGDIFTWLWENAIKPAIDGISNAFQWLYDNVIKPVWDGISNTIKNVWEKGIKPVIDTLVDIISSKPKDAFEKARDAIGKAWEGIQNLAKEPVRFVVDTVINGLINTLNGIPGVEIAPVKLPPGFATGGILPGSSSMGQGDDQIIRARRGEGIMVSEALRTATDRAAFMAVNANGRKGVGFAQQMAGFARGGLVDPLPKGTWSVSQNWGNAGHNGIDLAAPQGTHVLAAAAGRVGLASTVPMGGQEIYIQHENGLGTRYSHLSAFMVKLGDIVSQAQHIGNVGSTGMSTGPHLHYMVHDPGLGGGNYSNHVNPASFMGLQGEEKASGFNLLAGLVDWAMGTFKKAFPDGTMFIEAAGGILKEAVTGAVGKKKDSLGTDDSTGNRGSTGAQTIVPNLYDAGGILGKGLNVSMNKSGKPEAVLTNTQWRWIEQLAQGITAGSLGASPIGKEITAGLAKGILNGTGAVGSATSTVANTVLDTMRSDLDIHSPSKAAETIGKQLGAGLVKGMSGTAADVRAASIKLIGVIREQFGKLTAKQKERTSGISKFIEAETAKLVKLANQREAVLAKLDAARERLDEKRNVRDDWVQSVRTGILGQGDIGGMGSVAAMTRNLTRKINSAKGFNDTIAQLRKLGLDDISIQQLTSEFQSSGSTRSADVLLKGGKDAVAQINALQKQLNTQAGNVASSTGKMLYQAGIDAAAGLVKGLESQKAALDKASKSIADTITKRIKQVLGIKSPSRVLMVLGEFTGEGWVKGLLKLVPSAQDAADTLLSPFDSVTKPTGISVRPAVAQSSNSATSAPVQVIFEEGAIQVIDNTGDPRKTALETVDAAVEKIQGGL